MAERYSNKLDKIIRQGVFLCLAVALLLGVAAAQNDAPGPKTSRVVDDWISVIETQIERRLYEQAAESIQRVRQYESQISENQKNKIYELAARVEYNVAQTTLLLQNVETAGKLIDQGQYLQARAYLQEAADSKLLGDEQTTRIKLTLGRLNVRIDEQRELMKELYEQSRKDYQKGDFEKARRGFTVVASSGLYVPAFGKTAEEYLKTVEVASLEEKPAVTNTEAANTQVDVIASQRQVHRDNQTVSNSSDEEFGNVHQQNSAAKTDIKQEYLKAVVRDAQIKVNEHIGKAEFSLAVTVVQNAKNILEQLKPNITAEQFYQHAKRLQELSAEIEQQQRQWEQRWDTKNSGL
ncbi:MAG: hypothetical protein WC374_02225 [Phycisphaerae bacterium]